MTHPGDLWRVQYAKRQVDQATRLALIMSDGNPLNILFRTRYREAIATSLAEALEHLRRSKAN